MLDGGNALGLKGLHRLCDLVAELDAADALIAALNARGLSVNFDLEPDTTNAGRLDCEAARFTGNASVCFVATDHGVKRAMAANLLIDDDVYEYVSFDFDADFLKEFNCKNMARNAALHVTGAATIDAALFDFRRPRIVAPTLAAADGNHVRMAVEQ